MYRQVKFAIWFPVVMVAAFAAGYLFWQKTLVPGPYDLEPVNIIRNGSSNLPRDEVLRGWQTYRNEDYGFEVKYPGDWRYKEGYSYDSAAFFSNEGESRILILPKGEFDRSFPAEKPEISDFIIGGVLAKSRKYELNYQDKEKRIIWMIYNFMQPVSNWTSCDNELKLCNRIELYGYEEDFQTLNQILSTFKFTKP